MDVLELAQRAHRQLGGAEREVAGGQVQVLEADPLGDLVGAGADALHLVEVEVDLDLADVAAGDRSEEHTSELQSHLNLVCRLLLEKKKKKNDDTVSIT